MWQPWAFNWELLLISWTWNKSSWSLRMNCMAYTHLVSKYKTSNMHQTHRSDFLSWGFVCVGNKEQMRSKDFVLISLCVCVCVFVWLYPKHQNMNTHGLQSVASELNPYCSSWMRYMRQRVYLTEDGGGHRGKVSPVWDLSVLDQGNWGSCPVGVSFSRSKFGKWVQIKLLLKWCKWRPGMEKWSQNKVYNQESLEKGTTAWVDSDDIVQMLRFFISRLVSLPLNKLSLFKILLIIIVVDGAIVLALCQALFSML